MFAPRSGSGAPLVCLGLASFGIVAVLTAQAPTPSPQVQTPVFKGRLVYNFESDRLGVASVAVK